MPVTPIDLRQCIRDLMDTGLSGNAIARMTYWHSSQLSSYMSSPGKDLVWHHGNAVRELWRIRCRQESQWMIMIKEMEGQGLTRRDIERITGLGTMAVWQHRNTPIGSPMFNTGERIRLAHRKVCFKGE